MKSQAYFCDLCAGDGDLKLAVARYWNDRGEEWHCCRRHLSDVKQAGLEFEVFPEDGNVDLSRMGY
jgi:hypothetical protein